MAGIEKLTKELKTVGLIFIAMVTVFQIVFYKENFLVNLRVVAAFFWSFVLPGFMIMHYWHEKLDFLQRFVIGIGVGIALIGILSYYISLLGLHVKFHTIILPAVVIIAGFLVARK